LLVCDPDPNQHQQSGISIKFHKRWVFEPMYLKYNYHVLQSNEKMACHCEAKGIIAYNNEKVKVTKMQEKKPLFHFFGKTIYLSRNHKQALLRIDKYLALNFPLYFL